MVKKNECTNKERFPKRKSPRIKGYDYASPNYYFITVCTHQKKCIFWKDGKINEFGKIVYDGIIQILEHFPKNRVDKFVVMPNHIHMILTVEPDGSDISVVVGSFKSNVTKRIHEIMPDLKVWQASFHDHVIRNQAGYEKIWNYIDTNPIRWKDDCFYIS